MIAMSGYRRREIIEVRKAEITIAALLGHASGSITSRYVHALDAATSRRSEIDIAE